MGTTTPATTLNVLRLASLLVVAGALAATGCQFADACQTNQQCVARHQAAFPNDIHTCDVASGTCVHQPQATPSQAVPFSAPSSGAAYGSLTQASASYRNVGSLGEPTPAGVSGATSQVSAHYINTGGFNAANPP